LKYYSHFYISLELWADRTSSFSVGLNTHKILTNLWSSDH
jgi:hypothetical protein